MRVRRIPSASLVMVVLALACAASAAAQTTLYTQPHDGSSTVMKSAWYPPDGLDGDAYVWDDFTLASTAGITRVTWRGGYTNPSSGAGKSPVFDFTVAIYRSIGGGSQPDILFGPLVSYDLGTNAGETSAGTFGGVQMFDYAFDLPAAFVATAGTKYWLQIEASQGLTPLYYWPPDWGFAVGTGPNNSHFRAITGGTAGGGTLYQTVSGDAAFALFTSGGPVSTIAATISPAGAGTVSGAGPYPSGATASLTASANPGWGFLDWKEGATVVSTNPTYSFTVSGDRSLVAEFVPAYNIATSYTPRYGGTTAGDGVYLGGATVNLVATPAPGFVFVDWTEFGTEVSTAASYSFPAGADRVLVANFTPDGPSAAFDFDTATPPLSPGQGIPLSQTSGGITMFVSSPEGPAFSIQSDGTTHWSLPWFSGNYVYDNNLNRNTLQLQFDRSLDDIHLVFATADLNQTELPTQIQLTAFQNVPATPAVGSMLVRGAYIGATFPMGTLSFRSTTPFNLVQLVLPYQALGSTDFFIDDILVRAHTGTDVPGEDAPAELALAAAPNPSRGSTSIAFGLPAAGGVRLAVYDLQGRRVRELIACDLPAGRHVARWDGADAQGVPTAAGAYLLRLETPSGARVTKLVRLR